jgi:hypothetical protein
MFLYLYKITRSHHLVVKPPAYGVKRDSSLLENTVFSFLRLLINEFVPISIYRHWQLGLTGLANSRVSWVECRGSWVKSRG